MERYGIMDWWWNCGVFRHAPDEIFFGARAPAEKCPPKFLSWVT